MSLEVMPLDHENWEPILLDELRTLLEPVGRRWWIAGGVALDLFMGRSTRVHRDVDVMILRADQSAFQKHLDDWQLMVPTGKWEGEPMKSRHLFRRWGAGEWLDRDVSQAWCRPGEDLPWSFELLFAEGDSEMWRFKRDLEIARPATDIGSMTSDGLPYLLPEIVLLHKAVSSSPGENADSDFRAVLSFMEASQRDWLRESLERLRPEHPWLEHLK